MQDLIFLVVVAVLAALTLLWARSAALSALLIGFALSVAGTAVQFVATFGYGWTRSGLSVCLVVTLGATALAAWWLRRRHAGQVHHPRLGVVLLSSAVIAAVLTIVRVAAPSDLLQSVGYLITQPVGEDNAKWLATGAQLAADMPVDTFSAVGGPLLLVMTLAAAIASVLSTLTLGGVNEVAVSANSILLSQALLITVIPFAVAPLFEGRLTRWTPDGQRVRGSLPLPLGLLAVVVIGSASILVTQYGHLTLQYVLLSLSMWVAFWAMQIRRAGALVLTTLITAMTAQVWFPIGVLAVVLLLALFGYGVLRSRRPSQRRAALATAGAALGTAVMMWEFLRSSITFSLTSSTTTAADLVGGAARGVAAAVVTATESTLDIFGQPGGTEAMTATMVALLAIAVVTSFTLMTHGRPGWSKVTPFLPVAALLGFALGVVLLDFWSTGKGPGYATSKMLFATGIPILAVYLPIALLRLDPSQRRLTATRWAALAAIVFLLVADTFVPRAVARLKPAMFPVAGDPPTYWSLAEVRSTGDQPLSSNPLGCIYLPPGAERPSVLINGQLAYSCSRIMSGLTGAGGSASALVAWQLDEWLQNTSYWDYYAPALNAIPEDVRARNVILLGDKDQVVGLASLQSLLDRYPPDPASTP